MFLLSIESAMYDCGSSILRCLFLNICDDLCDIEFNVCVFLSASIALKKYFFALVSQLWLTNAFLVSVVITLPLVTRQIYFQ